MKKQPTERSFVVRGWEEQRLIMAMPQGENPCCGGHQFEPMNVGSEGPYPVCVRCGAIIVFQPITGEKK